MQLILLMITILSVNAIRLNYFKNEITNKNGCLTSQIYCNYTDSCKYIFELCDFSQCTNLTKLFNDNL